MQRPRLTWRHRRRALGLVVCLAILAGAIYGGFQLWHVARLDPPQRVRQLRAACADAEALHHAHLLEDAATAYGAIDHVDHARRCVGAVGPGSRRQTARAWRREVLGELKLSRELTERARVYRGASDLARQATDARGSQRAAVRARRAYMVALYINPGATGARHGLQRLLRGLGQPRTASDADALCALAGRLFGANLIPEARSVYARALRTGHTTQCALSGLVRLRAVRAEALRRLAVAQHQLAVGHEQSARLRFMAAYALDSSQSAAPKALADVHGPDPADARSLARDRHVVSRLADQIASGATWTKSNPDGIALALAAAAAAFVLLTGVLLWLGKRTLLRPWMDWVPFLHRFTRTRVNVAQFEGEADSHAPTVTTVFVDALRMRSLNPHGKVAPDSGDLDVMTGEATAGASARQVEDWISAAPSLASFAAFLKWCVSAVPRDEIRVTGQLLVASEQGVGLRLQVFTRRGRPLRSRLFWHREVLPGSTDAAYAYIDLARSAAPWVQDRKAK